MPDTLPSYAVKRDYIPVDLWSNGSDWISRNYPSFGIEETDKLKDDGSLLGTQPGESGRWGLPIAKWGLLRDGWAVPRFEG